MTESGGKTSIFGQNFGRSDRVRTCGIDIPNVARYQLRHTPIYSILRSDFNRNSATVGHYVVVSLL